MRGVGAPGCGVRVRGAAGCAQVVEYTQERKQFGKALQEQQAEIRQNEVDRVKREQRERRAELQRKIAEQNKKEAERIAAKAAEEYEKKIALEKRKRAEAAAALATRPGRSNIIRPSAPAMPATAP